MAGGGRSEKRLRVSGLEEAESAWEMAVLGYCCSCSVEGLEDVFRQFHCTTDLVATWNSCGIDVHRRGRWCVENNRFELDV